MATSVNNPSHESETANNVPDSDTTSKPAVSDNAGPGQRSIVANVCSLILAFYHANDFPIHILAAIGLARAYPPLGAEYLAPDITAKWLAVCLIFFLAGLGLRTSEFRKVIVQHVPFNILIQIYNFVVVSAIVFGVCNLLSLADFMSQPLIDGLIICSCLPMAINAGIVLTAAASGDEAAAVFNAAVGNIAGIFISPLLIVLYLPGAAGSVDLVHVFVELILRVLVPLLVGQALQKMSPTSFAFYGKHKPIFRKLSEFCLVYIVYTVFCKKFNKDEEKAGAASIIVLLFTEFVLIGCLTILAWFCLRFVVPNEPEIRVMGTLCGPHKTIALGVPLINSIFEGNRNEAFYYVPVLMWHPIQLMVGSLFTTRLSHYVTTERERLSPSSGTSSANGIAEAEVGNDAVLPEGETHGVETNAETQDVAANGDVEANGGRQVSE